MKVMITGHRAEKLAAYDTQWVKDTLGELVMELAVSGIISLGYSGMASGVDLFFCEACHDADIPFVACVPFDGQDEFMTEEEVLERRWWLARAVDIKRVRNRHMTEHCDRGIVVWDGNKGGTHNCLQQLLEMEKHFHWIIPQSKRVVLV